MFLPPNWWQIRQIEYLWGDQLERHAHYMIPKINLRDGCGIYNKVSQNGNVHISLSIGQSGAGLFVVMGAGPDIQHCWGVFSMLDLF